MAQRVLYVNASARIAGTENSLLELLRALDRGRFEPLAAIPGPGPLDRALREIDVPVRHVPLVRPRRTPDPRRLASMAARTLSAAVALARLARDEGAALVHAQTTAAQCAAGPAARLVGVPCVWHARGLRYVRALTPLLARCCDGFIAVSEAVLAASGLGAGGRIDVRVIPNGIDADAFAAGARPGRLCRELGLGAGTPLALVVSQMVPWKGHADFLRAMALARRRHPDAAAAVAGEDLFGEHPGYVEGLRELADSLGLAGAVRFLGYRTDVATLMADADLLVVPSEAEPFGRVALEAMSVGTPVVGRGLGGLPEVVEDGVTGRLTRTGSVEELGALIAELLADGEARRALGERGRRRVREVFGIAAHAGRVCALYDDLLAGRR